MTKSFKCDEQTQFYIDYIKTHNPCLKTESEIIRMSLEFYVRCASLKKELDNIK